MLMFALALALAQDVPATRRDWAWLANTYWIVPWVDLPAMQLDPKDNTVSWVVDQTVWQFQDYRSGYLWGRGVVLLRNADPARPGTAEPEAQVCLDILGTVTPEGAVHLTFVPSRARRSSAATTGTGRIAPLPDPSGGPPGTGPGKQFAFEMQMSTGDRVRTAHWAHMVQVESADPAWLALPGFPTGVEAALASCKELKGPGM